jgi:hypothetical protein
LFISSGYILDALAAPQFQASAEPPGGPFSGWQIPIGNRTANAPLSGLGLWFFIIINHRRFWAAFWLVFAATKQELTRVSRGFREFSTFGVSGALAGCLYVLPNKAVPNPKQRTCAAPPPDHCNLIL